MKYLIVLLVFFSIAAGSCRTNSDAKSELDAADRLQSSSYKGGRIGTYESFLYGAFETRMQAAQGTGFITPFYLYKIPAPVNDKGWQEMDFEHFGKDGTFQTQVLTPGNPRTQHQQFSSLAAPTYSGMHVYRMEWTPTALRFLVDGTLIREETDQVVYAKLFSQAEPMNLYVQLWAGTSNWSGVFDPTESPAYALFSYIQVETYTPGAGNNGSDFTVEWRDTFSSLNTQRWQVSSSSTPADGAVNSYSPDQVSTRNNNLILYFSN